MKEGFKITNEYEESEKPKDPKPSTTKKLPKTGIIADILMYNVILVIFGTVSIIIGYLRKKYN